MDKQLFLEEIASYLGSNHPEIFIEAYDDLFSKDFLNLTIFNDKQTEMEFYRKLGVKPPRPSIVPN